MAGVNVDPRKLPGWAVEHDEAADVLYATIKNSPGEPCECVEVGDFGLLEVGMFTGNPIGFRILALSELSQQEVSSIVISIFDAARKRIRDICERQVKQEKTVFSASHAKRIAPQLVVA